MHHRVEFAGFGDEKGERPAEMARLRGHAVVLIEVEKGGDRSGFETIGSVIDEHACLQDPSGASHRGARSFGRGAPSQ
jgi:hypothetical protein